MDEEMNVTLALLRTLLALVDKCTSLEEFRNELVKIIDEEKTKSK